MIIDFFFVIAQTLMQALYDQPPYLVEFTVSADIKYEVRHYTQTQVAAETTNDSDAFNTLAAYIGVGGDPQNEGSVDISMTTPVTIDMTAPVVIEMTSPVVESTGEDGEDEYMQFILPTEYDSVESAPIPLNDDVKLVEIPPHQAAAYTFRGWASDSMSMEMTQSLLSAVNATLQDTDYPLRMEDNTVELLQYNGPWTIGFMRRNEIKLHLSPEQVNELSEIHDDRKQMLRF